MTAQASSLRDSGGTGTLHVYENAMKACELQSPMRFTSSLQTLMLRGTRYESRLT